MISDLCFLHLHIAAEDDEMVPSGKKVRPGIDSSIISELTDCNAALSLQRKKRQVIYVVVIALLFIYENCAIDTVMYASFSLLLVIILTNLCVYSMIFSS